GAPPRPLRPRSPQGPAHRARGEGPQVTTGPAPPQQRAGARALRAPARRLPVRTAVGVLLPHGSRSGTPARRRREDVQPAPGSSALDVAGARAAAAYPRSAPHVRRAPPP